MLDGCILLWGLRCFRDLGEIEHATRLDFVEVLYVRVTIFHKIQELSICATIKLLCKLYKAVAILYFDFRHGFCWFCLGFWRYTLWSGPGNLLFWGILSNGCRGNSLHRRLLRSSLGVWLPGSALICYEGR
jgi:hypothetical protein